MNKLSEIISSDAVKICKAVDLSELCGKTILLSGASGLLGINFLACLKNLATLSHSDIRVFAIIQSEFPAYVNDFLDYKTVTLLRGDLTNNTFCESLPNADYIIHAAGYGQPGRFMADPVKTLQLNTSSTFALLKKLNVNGKFLFISTSELYSGLPHPPYNESQIGTTNTTHPRSCYIEGKRCGEAICNAFRQNGVAAKSARLALAYGPGTRPDDKRVLNAFIEKAFKGKITLMDQGNAKRTYCYVSDAVEILWNILLKGTEPLYNVGGFSHTTISELAEKIGTYLNIPVEYPDKEQDLVGAPDDVYLDMNKVKQEFRKTDWVNFDEGLQRTINWQKELYK